MWRVSTEIFYRCMAQLIVVAIQQTGFSFESNNCVNFRRLSTTHFHLSTESCDRPL